VEDKTIIIYPPGTGGNFLLSLLHGHDPLVYDNNEFKDTNSTSLKTIFGDELNNNIIQNYNYLKSHELVWADRFKNPIIISSKQSRVKKYTNVLVAVKHLFNVSGCFRRIDSRQKHWATLNNNKELNSFIQLVDSDDWQFLVSNKFIITPNIVSRIRNIKDSEIRIQSKLAHNLLFSTKDIRSIINDFVYQKAIHNNNWLNYEDINTDSNNVYYYEDIVIHGDVYNTPFENYGSAIQKYHLDNIQMLLETDRKYGTNLYQYIVVLYCIYTIYTYNRLLIMKTAQVRLFLKDNAMILVDTEAGIKQEISDHFTFFVPGHKFMPAFRKKVWDGKIRLFNQITGELNAGLYHKLRHFCSQRGYTISLEQSRFGYPGQQNKLDTKKLAHFLLEEMGLPEQIKPRDYQYKAIVHALTNKRAILLSPTGSGKSLIIYSIMRWLLHDEIDFGQLLSRNEKVLVIVPTTSLVEQMYEDFKDYGYDVESNVHKIYSGQDKATDKPVVISTWQSIYKLPGKWFEQFGGILGDECHGFKSKSLSSIMNKSRAADYRFGTTGTLDGAETHELMLEGVFGPVFKVTTTKHLQDTDTLAPLKISVLLLQYDEAVRKKLNDEMATVEDKKRIYHNEIDFIITHEGRNKLIKNLALTQKGNTLVLFQYVERHGNVLYEMIRDGAEEGRKIFYVHGGTDTSDREAIRKIVETQKDAVIVASLGTFSTGINIKNLHNIVFANPSKSQIKVLQSIGRGLRKSEDGSTTKLFDIADDLHWESRKNFTLVHSGERVKMYVKEQFEYKIVPIDIK
jgi:superfamily II DNA or RNA helicase